MISIHINHPDVLDFIKIKSDKTKVTGANISVRITDDFMEAVMNNKDYLLRFPVDLEVDVDDFDDLIEDRLYPYMDGYVKRINAKSYWNELIKQAKDNAEPGLMYWNRVLDYDPSAVYPAYKPITSNP